MARLADDSGDDHRPQVLTGDLNAEPSDPAVLRLRTVLEHDVGDCGLTFPTWNLTKRIDYVLARRLGRWRASSAAPFGDAATVAAAASDHLGLRVVFDAPPHDEL